MAGDSAHSSCLARQKSARFEGKLRYYVVLLIDTMWNSCGALPVVMMDAAIATALGADGFHTSHGQPFRGP